MSDKNETPRDPADPELVTDAATIQDTDAEPAVVPERDPVDAQPASDLLDEEASAPPPLVEPEPVVVADPASLDDRDRLDGPAPVDDATPVAEPTSLARPTDARGLREDETAVLDRQPTADDRATSVLPPVGAPPADSRVQTVYVTAPVPPKKRGNRGIGALLVLAAAIVFALLYAGLTTLVILVIRPEALGDAVTTFLTSPLFYVPVLVFLVVNVLYLLMVNRANWWAWVLGSFILAALVYLVSIGILLLVSNVFAQTPTEAAFSFAALALNPALIIAGLLSREVSIWSGAVISSRGRRMKQRNAEAQAEFEREAAEKRAEFERVAV